MIEIPLPASIRLLSVEPHGEHFIAARVLCDTPPRSTHRVVVPTACTPTEQAAIIASVVDEWRAVNVSAEPGAA